MTRRIKSTTLIVVSILIIIYNLNQQNVLCLHLYIFVKRLETYYVISGIYKLNIMIIILLFP